MIIREYQKGDYDRFKKMWADTGLGYPKRGDDETIILKTLGLGGRFLIMEDPETQIITGTSWITVDGRRSYLHHFGIHPEYQGKGLAKQLMDTSMKVVLEIGLQVKIEVHKENEIARDIYKKHGFKYLGDYDVFIIRDLKEVRVD